MSMPSEMAVMMMIRSSLRIRHENAKHSRCS
jgi:hypothetical protein